MQAWMKSMEQKWLYYRKNIVGQVWVKTEFLDPAQRKYMENKARTEGFHIYHWPGKGHERQCLIVAYGELEADQISGSMITIEDSNSCYKHKDILGALMSIGLKREEIGDLIFCNGYWYIITMDNVASVILGELREIKDSRVQPVQSDVDPPQRPVPKGKLIVVNVSSLRLDNLVREAYQIKRSEAQKLVAKGRVKVNYMVETKSAQLVKENDLISVAKYGRAEIIAIEGQTRKGRHMVKVLVYDHKE